MNRVPAVVRSSWLRQQLTARNPRLRVLDCSWAALDHHGSHGNYLRKHIKGAGFLDLNHCITPRETFARCLPEPGCFQEYARTLGIKNDSHLVCYDRNGLGTSSATKGWYLFRVFGHKAVSVLDGGLARWENEGYETASGEERSEQRGDFEVNFNKSLVVEFEEMVDIVKNKSVQIVDTRMKTNFEGKEAEPMKIITKGLESLNVAVPQTMHAGHMPGAANIFKMEVLDENTECFLSREDLLKLFASRGVDMTKPMVTTCYLGHSASIVNMAAHLCGKEDVPIYIGSWTEYGQKADADMIER